jgi:threonine aldolase
MNFGSDNVYGVHPKILGAINEANAPLTAAAYGHDEGSLRVERELSRVFERDVKAFLVLNGTAANSLALSAMVPPYGGVVCHAGAHINTDECGAPELFTGGAKLILAGGEGGKLTPSAIESALAKLTPGEHSVVPKAISISNATELGTIYTPDDVSSIAILARSKSLKLHMDGARFANALVTLGCAPADITWKSGVDVLSFGGTKNGGMILEAVVFFNRALADDFLHRRKRAGQHLSKGRYLSAQMLAYLEDDLWLQNAGIANALAQNLADGIKQLPSVRVSQPTQANEVFAFMPKKLAAKLEEKGALFYEWPGSEAQEGEIHVRFVLSFATPPEHVEKFVDLARRLA